MSKVQIGAPLDGIGKAPKSDIGHGWLWPVLATSNYPYEEVAMKISPDDPVALRPTWKTNLLWLFVVAVVVIAVAS
jgi:hypothetical protein